MPRGYLQDIFKCYDTIRKKREQQAIRGGEEEKGSWNFGEYIYQVRGLLGQMRIVRRRKEYDKKLFDINVQMSLTNESDAQDTPSRNSNCKMKNV